MLMFDRICRSLSVKLRICRLLLTAKVSRFDVIILLEDFKWRPAKHRAISYNLPPLTTVIYLIKRVLLSAAAPGKKNSYYSIWQQMTRMNRLIIASIFVSNWKLYHYLFGLAYSDYYDWTTGFQFTMLVHSKISIFTF